jgi:germination protein M
MTVLVKRPLRVGLVLAGVAALAAAMAVTICGSSPALGARAAATPTRVTVYFVRQGHLAPVRRVLPYTLGVTRAALQALLAGPTAAERKLGYFSSIPAGTTLRDVSIAGSLVTVDLTGTFASGGGSFSMLNRVAQVVFTATQFRSDADRVRFLLDGVPVTAIGGEGVLVRPWVSRVSFEAQAPPILVEYPLRGDTVTSPVTVRGTANVFEAWLLVDVLSPSGQVLAHRNVMASTGTGTRGTFSVTLPVSPGHRVVVAYTHSAKNGARIDVVRVPVTVR